MIIPYVRREFLRASEEEIKFACEISCNFFEAITDLVPELLVAEETKESLQEQARLTPLLVGRIIALGIKTHWRREHQLIDYIPIFEDTNPLFASAHDMLTAYGLTAESSKPVIKYKKKKPRT